MLDAEAAKAQPARGELRVERKGMRRVAVLLAADRESYVIPLLDKARLLRITERGLLLTGVEILPPSGNEGTGPAYAQTWWCLQRELVTRTEISPAEARALERRCQAEQIGKSMVSHYSRRGKFSP